MISLIVALDRNHLIGSKNRLPWFYKEDLEYFKQTTMGHDLLMGRLTFESILSYKGLPLPNRHHYVLTKTKKYPFKEVTSLLDGQAFVRQYPKDEELFIIGGRSLYDQFLPAVDRLYITHIDREFEGDCYFPPLDFSEWLKVKETVSDDLRFTIYERMK